jgi:hypothetical protein
MLELIICGLHDQLAVAFFFWFTLSVQINPILNI